MTMSASRVLLPGLAALALGVGLAMLCGPDGLAPPAAELLSLRASRVALAVVVGAALSAVGAALQSLLRNPLADPFVLGVSGGAAMGAAVAVAVGVAAGLSARLGAVTVGAILGAVATSALLLAFLRLESRAGSSRGQFAASGGGAVLVGVVVNAFSWAVVAAVRTMLPATDAAGLSVWLIGSLHHPEMGALLISVITTVVGVAVLVTQGGALTVMQGGDDDAARLGIDITRVRVLVVAVSSVLVATAVATTGVIGFVGLLVPHAVRRLGGGHDRATIVLSALAGGGLLAALDGVGRAAFVIVGSELPVGAVCALLGAPVLAAILVNDAREAR